MMPPVISALLAFIVALFRSRRSLHLEHLALRHQLAVYQRSVPRPRLRAIDRLFWAWLSRLWSEWQSALAFVRPRTVITWQHKRFRDHWRQLSQQGTPGRPRIAKDVRDLIRTMWQANPTWGAPRIVGELRKLGIHVAKSTVEKYRVRPPRLSSPSWKTFLKNHVQDLVALDFFIVPTVTHKVLFVLVILAHHRRRVIHFNITEHPTAQWTAQQVVEAFPWNEAPRYLLPDRDRVYGASFRRRVRNIGIEEVLIAPQSPWQNPYVERLIGSIRRECLDHVIGLHERHLRRLLTGYFQYDHHWRTHRALDMDCPVAWPVQRPELGLIQEVPEVGGLHHHYERRTA
ncbi:MAG TPA: integrase core domain-containing protein [Candidatus Binatia bacterium]|nr:integrase core domain-containing protein [Candidatus Binatia bacterium]